MSYTTRSAQGAPRHAANDDAPGAFFSDGQEQWVEAIPGERLRIRVHGKAVGGRYAILESVSQPLSGAPVHTHVEDEVFHIMEGVLTFEVAGQRIEAPAGSVLVVPGGVPHAWRNFGDGPARSLMTFTPGGVEDLFLQLGGLSIEKIVSLAASYGTVVLGPPLER